MCRFVFSLLLVCATMLGLFPAHALGQDATPGTTTGPLLDVLVDRSELPDDEGFFIIGRTVAQPGSRSTSYHPDEAGIIAIIVESGVLTYEIGGTGRILRDANSAHPVEETSPEGTPFTLEAGDALIFPAQKRVESNESDELTTFLWASALRPVPPPPPDPSDIGEMEWAVLGRHEGPWMAMADGPVAYTLRREVVAPGAGLPVVDGGMQAVSQETGMPGDLLVGGDGAAFNLGQEAVEALVMTIVPTATLAATPSAATAEAAASTSDAEAIDFEDIATVTLLAEAMPEDGPSFDAWLNVFAPDEELEFPSYGSQVNIAADVLLSGDYAAQSAGRMQRIQAGDVEEIAPDTEVMLDPGDSVVYVENSAAQAVRNPGDTLAETVSFGVFEGSTAIPESSWAQSGLAGHNVDVHVQRISLPPGTSLPPLTPDTHEPSVVVVSAGELKLDVVPSGDAGNPVATLQFLPGQVIPFRTLTEDRQFVFGNAGADNLVLIQLSLAAAESDSMSEGTPVS